jgi:hypothetical protein
MGKEVERRAYTNRSLQGKQERKRRRGTIYSAQL